jgi:hypothetical protein
MIPLHKSSSIIPLMMEKPIRNMIKSLVKEFSAKKIEYANEAKLIMIATTRKCFIFNE